MLVYYWDSRNIMNRWTLLDHFLVFLVVASYAPRSVKAKNKTDNEKTVVFPVYSESGHQLPVFDPVVEYVGRNIPMAPLVDNYGNPLCVSKPEDTFCEKVNYYPDNEIRKAIHYSSEEFKELFGTQTINPRKIIGDVTEETVCPQQARLFYPKAAVNENDQWAYVVNDVDYVQAVMSEMCENEDKPCSYLDGALPLGVSSYCRQKFAFKRLLALHPNQKKTYTDSFKFPSCCVCFVKKPFMISRTRMINIEDKQVQKPIQKHTQRSTQRPTPITQRPTRVQRSTPTQKSTPTQEPIRFHRSRPTQRWMPTQISTSTQSSTPTQGPTSIHRPTRVQRSTPIQRWMTTQSSTSTQSSTPTQGATSTQGPTQITHKPTQKP